MPILRDHDGDSPDLDKRYEKNNVETVPWYSKDLDPDLKNELTKRGLNEGRFLDLGTGPGTQAIELSKIGFTVTGTDLSENAIKKSPKDRIRSGIYRRRYSEFKAQRK